MKNVRYIALFVAGTCFALVGIFVLFMAFNIYQNGISSVFPFARATIDATTEESFIETGRKVRESLPESRRAEFDAAIQVLALSQINIMDIFSGGALGVENIETKMRESLHGKTGEEIIAEAERVRSERLSSGQQQELEEIRKLEEERVRFETAKEQLTQFEVIASRFYMDGDQPVIEVAVKNNTPLAVARAYFEGTLISPDRSVPWHQETFYYDIAGGLEPGEQAVWTIKPEYSGLDDVSAPQDAELRVEVQQLNGAKGITIYTILDHVMDLLDISYGGIEIFTSDDQNRLTELKQKHGVK